MRRSPIQRMRDLIERVLREGEAKTPRPPGDVVTWTDDKTIGRMIGGCG